MTKIHQYKPVLFHTPSIKGGKILYYKFRHGKIVLSKAHVYICRNQTHLSLSKIILSKIGQPDRCGATLNASVSFTSKLAFHIQNFSRKNAKKRSSSTFKTRCRGHSKCVRSLFHRSYFYKMNAVINFLRLGLCPHPIPRRLGCAPDRAFLQ